MTILKLYVKQVIPYLFDFMWKEEKLNTVASSMDLPLEILKENTKEQVEVGALRKVLYLALNSGMPVVFSHSRKMLCKKQ